jgi:orotidine-5'-phosphate decarboxylase
VSVLPGDGQPSTDGSPLTDSTPRDRLAVALDVPDLDGAVALARRVSPHAGVLKVGLELFTQAGPEAVRAVGQHGRVFLDLKLHDIPETVERAVKRAAELGARYLTLHATGGPEMLERAANAARETPLTLLAVTVLTSLTADDLRAVGVDASPSAHALRLADLAWASGVRGFVCSPLEVAALSARFPGGTFVTPGIRPAGAAAGDQKRIGTPADAIRDGASILVVGRPIRDAADPARAAADIETEIAGALTR